MKNYLLNFIIPAILVVLLSGCQNPKNFYVGKTVAPDKAVEMSRGEQRRTWQTFDLKIEHKIHLHENSFNISGQVEMSEHYKINYEQLKDFELYIVFLDSQFNILKSTILRKTSPLDIEDRFSFEIDATVPQRTKAYSFVYSGSAHEGSKNGSSKSFWHYPH